METEQKNQAGVFLFLGFIAVLFVGGAVALTLSSMESESTEPVSSSQSNNSMELDDTSRQLPITEDVDLQDSSPSGTRLTDSENLNAGSGEYTGYSQTNLTDGTNVIFFAASWCPTCNALDDDISENLSDIPGGVTILKADFDKETSLKADYEVRTQHTLVQVDQDGNMIKKWVGGNTLGSILAQIS